MRNIKMKFIFSIIIFVLLLYSYQDFSDIKTTPYKHLNNGSKDNTSPKMNSLFFQFNNYGTRMLFIENRYHNIIEEIHQSGDLFDRVYSLKQQITQQTITIFTQDIFLNLYESVNLIIIIGTVTLDREKIYELKNAQREYPQNRITILSLIAQNPGITFRELQRKSDLALGLTQYHIKILENDNQVEIFRLGKYKHFFLRVLDLSINQKLLISSCANKNVYIILKLILNEKALFQKDLVEITGYSKSLISYYIKILRNRGILESDNQCLVITNEFQHILSLI